MVRLPVEYQEVEYLESSGTQHINTEHLVQSEKIRIVASINATPSYGEQDLIGNQDSATGRFILGFYRYYVFLFARDSQGTEQNVISETFSNEASNFIIDAVYDLQNETKSLSVNGETYSGSHTRSIISTAKLKLFQNGQNSNKFVGKTRYLRIYEDDNLLFDFIPCYRKSDNEPGMYDTVSGTFFTNAGTGTFLVGNDVSWDTASLIERRRQILLNTPHLETISDSIASFKTDVSAPVKDCKIYFEPVQEGSGDPSPENVRPISGWDGVTVYKHGANLFPLTLPSTAFKGTFATGSSSIGSAANGRVWTMYVGTNQNLYYQHGSISPTVMFAFSDKPLTMRTGAVIYNAVNCASRNNVVINSTTHPYLVIAVSNGGMLNPETGALDTASAMLSFGNTRKSYEKRTDPLSLTIPFPQTIYGGYVDLVKGEVVEELGQIVLDGSEEWEYISSGSTQYYRTEIAPYGYVVNYSAICDKFPSTEISSSNTNSGISVFNSGTANAVVVAFRDRSIVTTFNSFLQWIIKNPLEIVYELATPITHQLTDGLNHVTLGQSMSTIINGRSSTGGYANSTATGIDGCKFVYFELGWTTEEFLQYSADISRRSEFVSDSRVLINGTTTDAKLGEMVISTASTTDYEGDALVYLYVSLPSDCTDLESKRAYLAEHPIKITYPKKTPIPYTVDLTDLKPVKGMNNIWSDANSNIEVKFWKH